MFTPFGILISCRSPKRPLALASLIDPDSGDPRRAGSAGLVFALSGAGARLNRRSMVERLIAFELPYMSARRRWGDDISRLTREGRPYSEKHLVTPHCREARSYSTRALP